MENKNIDLFNNPMVDMARKAMTPEQIEEYKRIGEYMYNDKAFELFSSGSKIKKSSNKDYLRYAECSLRSGLDPFELSPPEIESLEEHYGSEWYKNFGYTEKDVPKSFINIVNK
jgi:hypothetical protein